VPFLPAAPSQRRRQPEVVSDSVNAGPHSQKVAVSEGAGAVLLSVEVRAAFSDSPAGGADNPDAPHGLAHSDCPFRQRIQH
tara:strand:- start:1725 stop:1967 length:243 start_codon:yes stop_codon:yes gene_type:complete